MSKPVPVPKPRFFSGAAAFRAWLAKHHATRSELLVGFHRVGSARGTLTYAEALDEALCFGWIDGLRRSLDETSWSIRFTPRRRGSVWSAVNLRHVARLEAAGRMAPAGKAALAAREGTAKKVYSWGDRALALPASLARRLRADARAQAHFASMPPSYQRGAAHWIVSAKQETTRERRFAILLDCSRRGVKIPHFDYPRSAAPAARKSRPSRKA